MASGWWLHTALAECCRAIGALPQPICAPICANAEQLDAEARDWVSGLDALILGGGGDIVIGADDLPVATPGPASSSARDACEYRLLQHARARGLPVLGICRGAQLIQLALGGTLIDPQTDPLAAALHSDPDRYLQHGHDLRLRPDGWLARALSIENARVHSAHRWRIGQLAPGLVAEALCPQDQSIEAFSAGSGAWLLGVLWHPEFDLSEAEALAGARIFDLLRLQL